MSLRDELGRLVHEMDEEANAAAGLWSWLPSHAEAQKHHGDFWQDHQPTPAAVMQEAALYFSHLKNPLSDKMQREWFSCPCGEPHDGSAL